LAVGAATARPAMDKKKRMADFMFKF
jgi:hypothetical protein